MSLFNNDHPSHTVALIPPVTPVTLVILVTLVTLVNLVTSVTPANPLPLSLQHVCSLRFRLRDLHCLLSLDHQI